MTLNREDEDAAPRWAYLRSEYDPGQFVFDYFNSRQLADVAQSLGIELAEARQVTREDRNATDAEFSLRVVALSGGRERGTSASETLAGVLPTAALIEILARIQSRSRLQVITRPTVEGPTGMIAACRDAVDRRSWVILEGEWLVHQGPLRLQLVRAEGATSDLRDGECSVEAIVPASMDELMPTGRVRLTTGRRISANVFGQIESWSEEAEARLEVIAHAEFARLGDTRFDWRGASFGDNSNGDF